MPPLPSKQDYDEIVRRLKAVQTALTPKVQELRDVADWQRWANVGIQEQLCEKMEALKAVEDPEEIARQVRELQQQWRQAADVPRAQGEALWRRFKAAHDEVWARCEAHFAAQAERAPGKPGQEDRAVRARRGARRSRPAGFRPPTRSRAAGRVEDDRAGLAAARKRRSGSASAPPAIDSSPAATPISPSARRCGRRTSRRKRRCARRAEALAESTDWDAAAAEIRRLQAEWKTIGPVKKTPVRGDLAALPRRVRRFFARYAQRHDIARGERVAAREAICAELAAFAAPEHDRRRRAMPADPVDPRPMPEPAPTPRLRRIRSRRRI